MTAALGGQYSLEPLHGRVRQLRGHRPPVRLARRLCPDHRGPLPAQRLGHPGPGLRLPRPRTGRRRCFTWACRSGLFAAHPGASRRVFYRGLIGLSERRNPEQSAGPRHARARAPRRPAAGPGRLHPGAADHEPDADLPAQRRALGRPHSDRLRRDGQDRNAEPAPTRPASSASWPSAKPETAILGTALFMTICACLNGTASSSFSREGAQFWMSKIIPVAPRDQVQGKILHSLAIAGLGLAAAAAAGPSSSACSPSIWPPPWPWPCRRRSC